MPGYDRSENVVSCNCLDLNSIIGQFAYASVSTGFLASESNDSGF